MSLMSYGDEYAVIYDYDSSLGTVEISVVEDSGDKPDPDDPHDPTDPDDTPDGFSVRYADGAAIVAAPRAGTYTVIFAAYSGGALTSVEWKPVIFTEAGKATITPDAFNADGADDVKVMLWDNIDDMCPLCP